MECNKNKLKQLHDASLQRIEMKWESGKLKVVFGIHGDFYSEVELIFHEIRSLECPRMFPWGESIYVNEVSTVTKDETFLEIQMQSGDVIKIRADKLEVNDYEGS